MINLKNTHSSVPVSESIRKIEHKLIQANATNISKSYVDNKPVALIFTIIDNGNFINFKLPANPSNVYKYMIKQRSKPPTKDQEQQIREQAERTAWRSLEELTSIQIDYVLQEQADIKQLMLAHIVDQNGTTFYERLAATKFKGLLT